MNTVQFVPRSRVRTSSLNNQKPILTKKETLSNFFWLGNIAYNPLS